MLSPCCQDITTVLHTAHSTNNSIRRRRECTKCKRRWGTLEVMINEIVADDRFPSHPSYRQLLSRPIILYPSGKFAPFNREHIATVLVRAFEQEPD